MEEEVYHIPALLSQTIQMLDIQASGTYVDVTYGGGGHSRAIMEHLGADGRLVGFDQDEDAVAGAMSDERFTMVHGNFKYLRNFLRFHNIEAVDGILADLGVSFHHFDDATRGFSFRADAPLDMRMNRRGGITAADIVNTYSEEQIATLMHLYGEVSQSRRVARAIATSRSKAPITTINGLLEAIDKVVDPRKRKKDLACIFQALRIEVNGELDALRAFLSQSIDALRPGGRLVVITYHSLEDRLVKNFMRSGNFAGEVTTDLYGRAETPMRLITSKAIVADEAEVNANPRSRSAKLRAAQKL